ncbi:DUF1223 domain-containing protein [soil metagenome]
MKPILIAAAFAALLAPTAFAGAPVQPAVIELFTSQGCSSCPPANDNLAALSARPDVIALSFAVTYWDDLGWKDTFGQAQFTERQRRYESGLGQDGPSTPQIVVNGRTQTVGNRRADIERLIDRTARPAGPAISVAGQTVSVSAGRAPAKPADVWLVRYDPRVVQVAIRRGENGGKTLPHKNVVRELTKLGAWTGGASSFKIATPAAPGLLSAILVQTPAGPILSAAKI